MADPVKSESKSNVGEILPRRWVHVGPKPFEPEYCLWGGCVACLIQFELCTNASWLAEARANILASCEAHARTCGGPMLYDCYEIPMPGETPRHLYV